MANDILVDLILKDELTAKMKAARDAVDKMTDSEKAAAVAEHKLADSGDKVAKSHIDMGKAVVVANQALALGGKIIDGVGKALDATIGYTVEYAKQVRDLSRTIGASAEESSKLIQAADDVGISAQSIQAALEAAIRKGVKPTIDGIGQLADRYVSIQDPIARAAFLMENFGRSGSDLGALMGKGAAGIKALGDEAQATGLVLNQELLDSTLKITRAADDLGDRLNGLRVKFSTAVIPVLNNAVDGFEHLADAMTPTTDTEQKLKNAIVLLTLSQGENSAAVKEATNLLINYQRAQLKQTETIQDAYKVTDAVSRAEDARIAHLRGLADATVDLDQATRNSGEGQTALLTAGAQIEQNLIAQKEAAAAAAKELAAYQKSVDAVTQSNINSAISQGNLAESLKGADRLAIAKQAISDLEAAMKSGEGPGIGYAAMIQEIQLKNGLATKESIALVDGMKMLNDALISGAIAPEQYTASLAKLPQAARDGIVNFKEFGISTTQEFHSRMDRMSEMSDTQIVKAASTPAQRMKQTIDSATLATKALSAAIFGLPTYRDFVLNYKTVYSTEGFPPDLPPTGEDTGGSTSNAPSKAGATNTNNTTKIFNLNYFGQMVGNAARDFGALKALEGGL